MINENDRDPSSKRASERGGAGNARVVCARAHRMQIRPLAKVARIVGEGAVGKSNNKPYYTLNR